MLAWDFFGIIYYMIEVKKMKPKKGIGPYLIAGLIIGIIGIILIIVSYYTPYTTNRKFVTNNIVNNEITTKTVEYGELQIDDVDVAIQTAAKKVSDAVIGVTMKVMVKSGAKVVESNYAVGSGVIYKRTEVRDNEGNLVNYLYHVITNRHLTTVSSGTTVEAINMYVYLGNLDREIKATLVGVDSKVDLALLTFEDSAYINPVSFADSSSLNAGQLAIAIGNPDGYDYYGSVTFGVISGPLRYISTDTDNDGVRDFYAEYIQHDVPINPGNSGGGLFNLKGELIGINTLKIAAENVEGMGFAIPSNTVQTIVVNYLEAGVPIIRPRLGVTGMEIRSLSEYAIENSEDIISIPDIYQGETPYGIYVVEVSSGTTISTTEIEKHDIILAINDVKITRMYIINSKLNSLEDGFKVGETVTITYYDRSSGEIKTTQAVLKKS